jgi:hypothetical protein
LGDLDEARSTLRQLGYRIDELTADQHPVWHCWHDA